MNNKTELRAAAARLLYNDNRDTSDYNMLIDFIDNFFDNQQPQGIDKALYQYIEKWKKRLAPDKYQDHYMIDYTLNAVKEFLDQQPYKESEGK